jgi:hypothetical protein
MGNRADIEFGSGARGIGGGAFTEGFVGGVSGTAVGAIEGFEGNACPMVGVCTGFAGRVLFPLALRLFLGGDGERRSESDISQQ